MTKRQAMTKKRDKPKKVTVKGFLNKNLPTEGVDDKGKRDYYPLYLLVTYNRKNTMIRSYYGSKYYRDMKDVPPALLEFTERIMKRTVAYELNAHPDTFELKGLSAKYVKYAASIHALFEEYLKRKLYRIVIKTKPYELSSALNFNGFNVTFDMLLTIAQKIYPDFTLPDALREEAEIYTDFLKLYTKDPDLRIFLSYDFPTVIEWLDTSAVSEYRNKLEVVYRNDSDKINRCISLVDKVVRDSIAG